MRQLGSSVVLLVLAFALPLRAEVVVTGYDGANASVSAFASDADGDVPPLRRIVGAATQLEFSSSPAVDSEHDELVIAHSSPSRVVVFDLGADGNVAPIRLLQGPTSQIFLPMAVAVDTVHDELYVLGSGGPNHVRVYPRTANGDVGPLRSFTVAATEPPFPRAMLYDPVHEEIYVTMADTIAGTSVLVYDRLATGTPAPLRRLAGSVTLLTYANSLALDTAHDELFVLQGFGTYALHTFARTADGNVAPLRTLAGPNTGGTMQHVAYDHKRDELVLDNNTQYRVFPRTASGNVTPLRLVGGTLAGINGVGGLAIAPDRLFEDGFESGTTTAWSITVP